MHSLGELCVSLSLLAKIKTRIVYWTQYNILDQSDNFGVTWQHVAIISPGSASALDGESTHNMGRGDVSTPVNVLHSAGMLG